MPDGSSCSDGNVCNGDEVCQGQACRAGTPLNCDDGNPLTVDTCDPATGCVRNDVMVAAQKVGIREGLSSVKLKLAIRGTVTFSDPGTNDTNADPVLNGGSIEIISGDGSFDQVYSLPPSNWAYVGPPGQNLGYRYRDHQLALGPVRAIALRDGGRGSIMVVWPRNDVPLDANPNPLGVIVTLGGTRYCMTFGGTTTFVPGNRYTAIDAPAPTQCAR